MPEMESTGASMLFKKVTALVLAVSCAAMAQIGPPTSPQIRFVSSDPTGNSCGSNYVAIFVPSGSIYTCDNGVVAQAGGGGSSVGKSSRQIVVCPSSALPVSDLTLTSSPALGCDLSGTSPLGFAQWDADHAPAAIQYVQTYMDYLTGAAAGTVSVYVVLRAETDNNVGHSIVVSIQSGFCIANSNCANITWNTAQTATIAPGASANGQVVAKLSGLTMTGAAADTLFFIRVGHAITGYTDTGLIDGYIVVATGY